MQAPNLQGRAQDLGNGVVGVDERTGESGTVAVRALNSDRQTVSCGFESVDERLMSVFVGIERGRELDAAGVGQDRHRVCLAVGVASNDEAGIVVKSWFNGLPPRSIWAVEGRQSSLGHFPLSASSPERVGHSRMKDRG